MNAGTNAEGRREMVNAFALDTVMTLAPRDARLVERRLAVLGPLPSLFYRRPVHVVRGEGAHLYDADGRQLLDCYNNVAGVGHANPAVTASVSAQLATLNTHNRYLQDGVVDYAEQLLETFPLLLDRVMFTNSGSEANDLAIRMARVATGNTGVVVTANAYHGTTDTVAGFSPSLGLPLPDWVRTVEVEDLLRRLGPSTGSLLRARFEEAIGDLERTGHGLAAVVVDSILSSDGIFAAPPGFLKPVADAAHAAGGLYVADEVQAGFGRTGDGMWGFSRHALEADVVTLGKPMGNGVPIGGVVHSTALGLEFSAATRYFNTFGGNPVSVAAAAAVLSEMSRLDLVEHAARTGDRLMANLRDLLAGHRFLGEVRGAGLFIGVDCVRDPESLTPDPEVALEIVNALRERGVLISASGRAGHVLKIRPPLVFSDADADRLLECLSEVVDGVPDR